MLTIEHKEILHAIRQKMELENFDALLEDDAVEKFNNILQSVEQEFIDA